MIFYLIMFFLGLSYIITPLLARKFDSLEMSTFLIALGYGGNMFSNKSNKNAVVISKNTYLEKSFLFQSIMGLTLICYSSFMYLLGINEYLSFIISIPFSIIATCFVWFQLKRYKVN